MTTPLQKAAQAVIAAITDDEWIEAYEELRKALDAELQQSVEPVGYFYFVRDGDVWKQAGDMQFKDAYTPLYLHPPQKAVPKGYALVPTEVQNLYNFMTTAFVPMTSQQKEIWVAMDLARKVVAAQGEKP